MGFMVRPVLVGTKPSEEITLAALERVVPHATVCAVAAAHRGPKQRRRKLPGEVVLLVCILMHLYPTEALDRVLGKLYRGRRLLGPAAGAAQAGKSALCQARARLGVAPVVDLFHRVCRPLATPATPGAFLFGLRVMGLDGTVEAVPDTPANARAFGRHHSRRGASAFPQVLGIYLVECGTHAVVDASFWPCHTGERVGGLQLLRTVTAGMLLLWDRGFHSFEMVAAVRDRGAHVLGRVSRTVKLVPKIVLPDGSYWTWLQPSAHQQRKAGVRLRVRVIVYTLTDPTRPGCRQTHRLVTTLLDPQAYPAHALILAYHERWEVELTIDELDTHQRLARQPLRSQKPEGVRQELYGLVIAHYALRTLMCDAATDAGLDPDRISFVRAVSLLQEAIADFQVVAPAQHAALYAQLVRDLARHPLPPRALRTNPRVVKRKMSNFKLKRPAHRGVHPLALPFASTVQILPPTFVPDPQDCTPSHLLLSSLI
jgi:Insertion element 4 transposase N-terminal/Transposase DDE domain